MRRRPRPNSPAAFDIRPSLQDGQLAADLALPIEELDLTVRSYNLLKREGIDAVGELIARTEAGLLDIPNFGHSIDDVKVQLARIGLGLKDAPLASGAVITYDAVSAALPHATETRPARGAGRIAQTAVRVLPALDRARYSDEFRSELYELAAAGTSWWGQLLYAIRLLDRVWVLRAELQASVLTRGRS